MTQPPDYMTRVFNAFGQGLFTGAGGTVSDCAVLHDDDCLMLHGHEECTCTPDIVVSWVDKETGETRRMEVP